MRPLTESLLRDLAGHQAPLCLSLLMEVARGGGDHNHIRISLKNAKSDAMKALESHGEQGDDGAVAAVRARLEALDYDDVVGGNDRRVAVYIAPDRTEVVDARFDETGVHVGPVFRLAPLLTGLERTPEHAILAASEDSAVLYRASDGALHREEVADMPGSLGAISRFTDQQEKGNVHGREDSGIPGSYKGPQAVAAGSGTQGVPHHSMGGHDWREDKEQERRHYANLVINAVQEHLSGRNLPLIVAADERLHGMIRESSEYPFLVEKGITHHPREMDESRLREAAAACLSEDTTNRRAEAWDRVAMSLGRGDGEAGDDPAAVVSAAASGRVAQLFVRPEARLRGRFDPQGMAADLSDDGPEDLIDRAIAETIRNGGEVFPLGDAQRKDALIAAAYRYPG